MMGTELITEIIKEIIFSELYATVRKYDIMKSANKNLKGYNKNDF